MSDAAKVHNLKKENGKWLREKPSDYHKKTTTLAPVDVPHPGASYNPSFADHQALLRRAADVEVRNRERAHFPGLLTTYFLFLDRQGQG